MTLPVTIEQIATAIKQMNALERGELLRMVPELNRDKFQEPFSQCTNTQKYGFREARNVLKNVNGSLSDDIVNERGV